jgi:hypothetical protein
MLGNQAVPIYIPAARLPDTTHRRLVMLRHCDSITSRKPPSAYEPAVKLWNSSVVAVDRLLDRACALATMVVDTDERLRSLARNAACKSLRRVGVSILWNAYGQIQ